MISMLLATKSAKGILQEFTKVAHQRINTCSDQSYKTELSTIKTYKLRELFLTGTEKYAVCIT
jgi:hypothetical protein